MSLKNARAASSITSGIVGGAAFLVFFLLLDTGFIVSLAVAFAGYLGVSLILTPEKTRELEFRLDGLNAESIRNTIDEGKQKVNRMREYCLEIDRPKVRKKVERICIAADNIFDDFKKDPKDIKAARKFLSYYLDAAINIIGKYTELSSRRVVSQGVENSLAKVEEMLETLGDTFERQLHKLLEDDILDLDTEISLLEKTIKSEGL